MNRLIAIVCSVLVCVAPAGASPRHCSTGKCFKAPVVVKNQFVEKVVPVVAQQNVVHYFVGSPAGLAYQPLQQAHYGQLERQLQRLADRFADLGQLQQQQMAYQPYGYAPPQQYVQPQQAQPQCGQCHGQGQPAPPLQQQQQAACDKCGCAKPQQPEQLPPPDESKPAFSMKLGPDVIAKCAKCHNNDKAAGDLNFEQPLTFAQKSDALLKAATGEMPKEGDDLTDEELRQLADQLFRMPTADAEQPKDE